MDFIYIECPNCKMKIKADKDKKYHDCEECGFEFCLEPGETAAPPKGQGTSILENLKKLSKNLL